jgi:hypothetical protein
MSGVPQDNPFQNEDKQFDTEEEYLDRLQEDLSEKGYEVEWGERIEENGKEAVEVVYEGSVLEDLRVPLNLEVINKQMGPLTGYDMMLDTVESVLYYDESDGDIPFIDQN